MEILKTLAAAFGPSGREDDAAGIIEREAAKYADDVRVDNLGNIIAVKRGKGSGCLMLAAHMDQIGIAVTSVDESGNIKFVNVGDINPYSILYHGVGFKDGVYGVVAVDRGSDMGDLKFGNLHIDIGVLNHDDALKRINTGDLGVFASSFIEEENTIISGALDDRAGCYVLIETLKRITENIADIYFTFNVQGETNSSGAAVSAYGVSPEYAIVVDAMEDKDVKFGGGPVIKTMDRRIIYSRNVRDYLFDIAQKNNIPFQLAASQARKGEGLEIALSRSGVSEGVLSLPFKHEHTVSEMMDKRDIEYAIELLVKASEGYRR